MCMCMGVCMGVCVCTCVHTCVGGPPLPTYRKKTKAITLSPALFSQLAGLGGFVSPLRQFDLEEALTLGPQGGVWGEEGRNGAACC